jgi:hypothetical protein
MKKSAIKKYMQTSAENIKIVKEEFEAVSYCLNERQIRLRCAAKAGSYNRINDRGGITVVHKATGVSRPRIYGGLKEIGSTEKTDKNRIGKTGGGRRKITGTYPEILKDSEVSAEPLTGGDAESPLRWTCKSTYRIRDESISEGYRISRPEVGELLSEPGYSPQSDRKTEEGGDHCDRNEQFEYISRKVENFQENGQPSVSADTGKKENIGNYADRGREYQKKGSPEKVNVYDFINKELGKVAPYGIYNMGRNEGFVNVGISNDTAESAVNSINNRWDKMGKEQYPDASEVLITADCGGSNGYRVRLWKTKLQEFADKSGLVINVCHFPPGTGRWNRIGHKMFCFISQNRRGRPSVSRETVVNLIGSTKNNRGLKIKAEPDENIYEKGIKISDEELAGVNIERDNFHGEWNYKIIPKV